MDATTRACAIEAARIGMSLEGIAHLCGYSRSHFSRVRTADPEFDSQLMRALATHEQSLASIAHEAIHSDNGALHASALKGLAQRYPQRHGVDPRLRLDARAAREGYAEDLDDASLQAPADQTGAVIARLVERMLTEDESDV